MSPKAGAPWQAWGRACRQRSHGFDRLSRRGESDSVFPMASAPPWARSGSRAACLPGAPSSCRRGGRRCSTGNWNYCGSHQSAHFPTVCMKRRNDLSIQSDSSVKTRDHSLLPLSQQSRHASQQRSPHSKSDKVCVVAKMQELHNAVLMKGDSPRGNVENMGCLFH